MNRRLVLLALWLLCLCALAWWTLARLRVTNDLSLFLPEAVSMDGRLLLTQVREGVAASTLLAAIAGERPSQDIARASRALAEGLRQDRQFARVANGELGSIDQSELDTLFTHRFLVGPPGPCLDALTVTGLQQALVARLAELRGPVPVLDGERTGSDPVGCFPSLLAGLSPHDGPARTHGVWFSRDGRRALAIFQTRGDASDIAGQRAAINRLQSLFASLPEAQGLHLELSGPGYFAVASEQAISSETQYLSIVATVLVLAILWFAFDSAALVMLGMLPVLSGILVGVALVSALFGPVHGIALALAFTLMGVTLDYPVHVFAHIVPGADAAGVDAGMWRSLLLGVLTTILGYGALALANFPGLAQLGVLSGAALATAALCARYLLPALIPAGYRLPTRPWLARWPSRLPVLPPWVPSLALVGALALLAATLIHNPAPWDADLARLSTIPVAELERDRHMRDALGATDVARMLYTVGKDPEAVLTAIESALPDLRALVTAGQIRGFEAAPQWLPSRVAQLERQSALPDRTTLVQTLNAAAQDLPFRTGAFAPFLDAVDLSRTLPPLVPDDLQAGPLGTRLALLLQPLGDAWVGLVPLIGVSETNGEVALRALAASHGLHYLDLRAASARLIQGFLDETLWRTLIMSLVITGILAIGLGDLRHLWQVSVPIMIAILVDFSLLVIVGGAVNLFHLISLVLVFGLAIDYSLFFNRPMVGNVALERTSLSLSVCALSTLAMFGLLSLSSIPALRAIGSTVAIGVSATFAVVSLFAPSRVGFASGATPAAQTK